MPDLYITWTPPSNTTDIESIVLYRKKDATNCAETLSGDLLYETTDFSTSASKFTDQDVPDGAWRYAAFSKNAAGLSPCATDTYNVLTDTAPTVGSPLADVNAWDASNDMTIDLSGVFVDAQGDIITKTASSSDSSIVSTSVNGDNLVLSFSSGKTGSVTITVTGLANGKTVTDEFTVAVVADGDSDGDGIPDSQDPYPDSKDQTISFSNIVDWQVVNGAFSLTATSTSTLPVTFTTADTDVLEINGNTVTPKNNTNSPFTKTVTITATQSGGVLGGEDWKAAPNVQKSFVLSDPDSDGDGLPDSKDSNPDQQPQTIAFGTIPAQNLSTATYQLNPNAATSGLTVTYTSSNPSVATVNSAGLVTFVAIGSATITASQGGNNTYLPAPDVPQTLTIESNPCPGFSVSASSTPNTVWNGSSGTATATASGGSGSYTYLWGNGATAQTITGLGPNTTHTVTITDSNGCTESASTTVAQGASAPDPCAGFSVSASSTQPGWGGSAPSYTPVANGTATAIVSGGSGTRSYLWGNGATTQTITGLSPNTTHTVTVTTSTGCTASASVTVGSTTGHPCMGKFAVAWTKLTSPTSGQSDGSLRVQIFGTSNPPFSVTLTEVSTGAIKYSNSNLTATEFTANNLRAGSYKLHLTDIGLGGTGCNFVNAQGELLGDYTLF